MANVFFVLVAGMDDAIQKLRDQGISIFCYYQMIKAISNFYSNGIEIKQLMGDLESKLAFQIDKTNLQDYSLGYKKTEAIFVRKNKNIPNNVFPIFWWKAYRDGSKRKTLFCRVQNGY